MTKAHSLAAYSTATVSDALDKLGRPGSMLRSLRLLPLLDAPSLQVCDNVRAWRISDSGSRCGDAFVHDPHGPRALLDGGRGSLDGPATDVADGESRVSSGCEPGRLAVSRPDQLVDGEEPDAQDLAAAVVALEEHGFSVEVVDELDAARSAVLARIPDGSSVMTSTSVTLQEAGIADAINDGGPYQSARNKILALDFGTQAQEMKAIGVQPDYVLGSVHAVTRDGTLVIASASGSQLASYAWGATSVIFVIGAQKLVPTLEAAHERIYQHSLKLEDARAQAAYGQHSYVGKVLEIHQDLPGRIHIVLIRQPVGF